jgi:hypothetical protein
VVALLTWERNEGRSTDNHSLWLHWRAHLYSGTDAFDLSLSPYVLQLAFRSKLIWLDCLNAGRSHVGAASAKTPQLGERFRRL